MQYTWIIKDLFGLDYFLSLSHSCMSWTLTLTLTFTLARDDFFQMTILRQLLDYIVAYIPFSFIVIEHPYLRSTNVNVLSV